MKSSTKHEEQFTRILYRELIDNSRYRDYGKISYGRIDTIAVLNVLSSRWQAMPQACAANVASTLRSTDRLTMTSYYGAKVKTKNLLELISMRHQIKQFLNRSDRISPLFFPFSRQTRTKNRNIKPFKMQTRNLYAANIEKTGDKL